MFLFNLLNKSLEFIGFFRIKLLNQVDFITLKSIL